MISDLGRLLISGHQGEQLLDQILLVVVTQRANVCIVMQQKKVLHPIGANVVVCLCVSTVIDW